MSLIARLTHLSLRVLQGPRPCRRPLAFRTQGLSQLSNDLKARTPKQASQTLAGNLPHRDYPRLTTPPRLNRPHRLLRRPNDQSISRRRGSRLLEEMRR
jgi:hypothetical protein